MVESTKPAIESDDEPEILAHYAKVLPKGCVSKGYELKKDITVEIERSAEGWVATVDVECLFEYGWGDRENEAIDDLVCSLGEYRLSLIDYGEKLGGCSKRCLELLEDMVT